MNGTALAYRWFGFALAAWLFATLPLRAAELVSGFEQANKFYEQGNYQAAVDAYGKLMEGGKVSAALYFNRGNALFKLGQLGRAIASYRQAERLAPRDPDVRANLQFARTQARGGTPYQLPASQRYLEALTVNEWTALAAASGWLLFLGLALAQWRPELSRKLRPWTAATATVLVVFGSSLAAALNHDYFTATAIVTTGETDVRIGPLDESQSVYKVRDGMELKVLDRKDDWLQVEDSAQRLGWIKKDQVLLLKTTTPTRSPSQETM